MILQTYFSTSGKYVHALFHSPWMLHTSNPCSDFNPVLTDAGICYAFNAKRTREVFADSEYIDSVIDHFVEWGDQVVNSRGSGEAAKKVIGLDIQTSR